MDHSVQLTALSHLTRAQKDILKRGNIKTITDVVLLSPEEIGKRCRASPLESRGIIDAVLRDCPSTIRPLKEVLLQGEAKCTTGDEYLDRALGGGIRTGMVWEIVGESSAGKTQLALQLSLLVQLPSILGGLSGSACYLTTSSQLPTKRLLQMIDAHHLLSPSLCGLSDIHTLSTQTIPTLIHVLSHTLPSFMDQRENVSDAKPVKLLVIDTLTELFHDFGGKTDTKSLVERARNIGEISSLLHDLANGYQIAVVVLNEVVDVFDRAPSTDSSDSDLSYSGQSRWFGRADSIGGEDKKEASLGLVWANQINTRVLLSRTGRRRYLDENPSAKRTKQDPCNLSHQSSHEQEATLIRRLSVIFSSVAAASISLDYIVNNAGIIILPTDDALQMQPSSTPLTQTVSLTHPIGDSLPLSSQIAPLDVGFAEGRNNSDGAGGELEDEWDALLQSDDISDDTYHSLDIDPSLTPINTPRD